MWQEIFMHRGWRVYLSAGGASMIFPDGDFTSQTLRDMPTRRPSMNKLREMADIVVDEHEGMLRRAGCTPAQIEDEKRKQIMTDAKTVIRDWMLFHVFDDDCEYPLISPSDVVLEDLEFRLGLASKHDAKTIRQMAKERYDAIPSCKGKEKRLRRK